MFLVVEESCSCFAMGDNRLSSACLATGACLETGAWLAMGDDRSLSACLATGACLEMGVWLAMGDDRSSSACLETGAWLAMGGNSQMATTEESLSMSHASGLFTVHLWRIPGA